MHQSQCLKWHLKAVSCSNEMVSIWIYCTKYSSLLLRLPQVQWLKNLKPRSSKEKVKIYQPNVMRRWASKTKPWRKYSKLTKARDSRPKSDQKHRRLSSKRDSWSPAMVNGNWMRSKDSAGHVRLMGLISTELLRVSAHEMLRCARWGTTETSMRVTGTRLTKICSSREFGSLAVVLIRSVNFYQPKQKLKSANTSLWFDKD